MRLISQHGQLDGSTGRDNRQINCPLRASGHYKAAHVPGNSDCDLRGKIQIKTGHTIRQLRLLVGSSLRNIRRRLPVWTSESMVPPCSVAVLRQARACKPFRFCRPTGKNFAATFSRDYWLRHRKGCLSACRQGRASDIEHHRQKRVVAADPTELDHPGLSKDVPRAFVGGIADSVMLMQLVTEAEHGRFLGRQRFG
jgi:hypothetical protein